MITKQQVETQFRAELSELLKKWSTPGWNADITLVDVGTSWSRFEEMEVTIPSLYDEEGIRSGNL